MEKQKLSSKIIAAYENSLRQDEHSLATIEKYLRDIRFFVAWLAGKAVTKEAATQWKLHLMNDGFAPATINSKLAAINGLFRFLGWNDCRVKFLRLQRRVFRDNTRDLTREDYRKLVSAAEQLGRGQLALLLEAICATGIRVSEVRYLTVEAVRTGQAEVTLKGKVRIILLPNKLCRKLERYARKQKIASGELFLTKRNHTLSRQQIWREMKALCREAGVTASKVFPHNLRHLFANTFYKVTRDIVKLADVLGHSSINTTRIYLLTTSTEHIRQLERLGLVN
jgi:integrase/recombinase XerD